MQAVFSVLLVALTVLAVRLILLGYYGSVVPFWDQWDAEAAGLFKPYIEGNLPLSNLIAPHNEHRILTTRLLALGLFELRGAWDPILEMIVNTIIFSGFAGWFSWLIGRGLPIMERWALTVFCAALFAVPLGWQNLLQGFQVQFYFLLIFSTLALCGFANAIGLSLRWWGSGLAAVAAFFSLASGALVVPAVLVLSIVQLVLGVRQRSFREVAAILLLVVTSAIMLLSVPTIPSDAGLKAQSIGQWIWGLIILGSYPSLRVAGLIGIHFPLLIFTWRMLRRSPSLGARGWFVVGLGIWLAAQMASIAYGRAVGILASRYFDIVLIGLPLNYVALRLLLCEANAKSGQRWWTRLSAVWLIVAATGVAWWAFDDMAPAIMSEGVIGATEQQNTVAFLKTGDIGTLENKPHQTDIPYPDPKRLAMLLSDPTIRAILPDQIRPADADTAVVRSKLLLKGGFGTRTIAAEQSTFWLARILLGVAAAGWLFALTRVVQRPPAAAEGWVEITEPASSSPAGS